MPAAWESKKREARDEGRGSMAYQPECVHRITLRLLVHINTSPTRTNATPMMAQRTALPDNYCQPDNNVFRWGDHSTFGYEVVFIVYYLIKLIFKKVIHELIETQNMNKS